MSTKIEIIKDDITNLATDAIVNAANKTLLGGGGIDGAIHYKAGEKLLEECKMLGGCQTGEAKITKGYNLPSSYIIHTVGPIYGSENGEEENLLRNCYINSLKLAHKNNLHTIAFPAISTGAFRYPKDEAAKIALETVNKYIKEFPKAFDKVVFVLFNDLDYLLYKKISNNDSTNLADLGHNTVSP